MNIVGVVRESCKGVEDCGLCLEVCPKDVLAAGTETNARGYLPPKVVHPEACVGCGMCMRTCPDYAMVVEKTEETA